MRPVRLRRSCRVRWQTLRWMGVGRRAPGFGRAAPRHRVAKRVPAQRAWETPLERAAQPAQTMRRRASGPCPTCRRSHRPAAPRRASRARCGRVRARPRGPRRRARGRGSVRRSASTGRGCRAASPAWRRSPERSKAGCPRWVRRAAATTDRAQARAPTRGSAARRPTARRRAARAGPRGAETYRPRVAPPGFPFHPHRRARPGAGSRARSNRAGCRGPAERSRCPCVPVRARGCA